MNLDKTRKNYKSIYVNVFTNLINMKYPQAPVNIPNIPKSLSFLV